LLPVVYSSPELSTVHNR